MDTICIQLADVKVLKELSQQFVFELAESDLVTLDLVINMTLY
jgi:hypothetical protein